MLGEIDRGIRPIFDLLNSERISTPSEYVARGRWVLEEAVQYANE